MSVSRPFIERPIATSLLALATHPRWHPRLFLLPISSLPQVDFPTVEVTTSFRAQARRRCRRLSRRRSSASSAKSNRSLTMSSTSLLRPQPHYAAIQPRPRYRCCRSGRAGRDQCGGDRRCRRNLPYTADLLEGEPGRHANRNAGADFRLPVTEIIYPILPIRMLAQRMSSVSRRRPRFDRRRYQTRRPHRSRSVSGWRATASAWPISARRSAPPTSPGPKGSLDRDKQSYHHCCQRSDRRTPKAYEDVIVAYRNDAPVRLKDFAKVNDGLENTARRRLV